MEWPDDPDALLGFLCITLLLGGAGAVATGHAVALSWRSLPRLFSYMLLLAAAVRFLHFALWQEELLSSADYAVDLLCLLALSWLGFAWTRKRQMRRQYPWIRVSDPRV